MGVELALEPFMQQAELCEQVGPHSLCLPLEVDPISGQTEQAPRWRIATDSRIKVGMESSIQLSSGLAVNPVSTWASP